MRAHPLRQGVAILAALLLTSLFTVIFVQIFLRLIGHPLIWAEEFASVAFIWLVFLGAALAAGRDEHLDVDLVYKALTKDRSARAWDLLILAAQILFLVVLAVGCVQMAHQTWGNSMGALRTLPYGAIYLGVLFGAALYLAALIRQVGRVLRGKARRDTERTGGLS